MEATIKENQSVHSRPPISQLHPWLLICHGKNIDRQTFFSISDNRYYRRVIPEMRNKFICTSAHGWLVLQDFDSDDCFLWNPMSMEKLELPPLSINVGYNIFILSAPPSDPNCHIMFVDTIKCSVVFCQPGDHEFVQMEFEIEKNEFEPEDDELELDKEHLMSATIFEGKIYGITGPSYKLVFADFSGPTLKFRLVLVGLTKSLQSQTFTYTHTYYLVDGCGELLFVRKVYVGLDYAEVVGFTIFRVDFTKMAWVELKSLGKRTLFLGWSQGMSCFSEEAGIKGNCIYFVESYRHDRNLYIFDLEDQSIAITLPCHVSRCNSYSQWMVI